MAIKTIKMFKIGNNFRISIGWVLILLLSVACGIPDRLTNDNDNDDLVETPISGSDAIVEEDGGSGELAPPNIENVTRRLKIVAIQPNRCEFDASWCPYEESMQDAAAQLDIDFEIRGFGSLVPEQMGRLIFEAVDEGVDGLAVPIIDPILLKEPLNAAAAARIPVVAYRFGTGPETDNLPYLTFFGQNSYISGIMMGNELRQRASSDLRGVACIINPPLNYWVESRCAGLRDALNPHGVDVDTVILTQETEFNIQSLDEFIEDAVRFLNPKFAFITTDLGTTRLFYQEISELPPNVQNNFIHATFERSDLIDEAVQQGLTEFAFSPKQYSEGYSAIRSLTQVIRFGLVQPINHIDYPVEVVDSFNITGFENTVEPDRPLKLIQIQHAVCEWEPFWCVVEKGTYDAAAKLGIEVDIRGPSQERAGDTNFLANLIDLAIAEEPDGLIVTIPNREVYREPLRRAEAAGIPIVAINSGAGAEADQIPYLSLIAQDEFAAGRQSGLRMVQVSGTSQNRGVCLLPPDISSLVSRCAGFADAMDQLQVPYTILPVSTDGADVKETLDSHRLRFPDTNLVLTLTIASSEMMFEYIEERELASDNLIHATFDISPLILDKIKAGVTRFTIDQQPYLQGYLAVESFHMLLRYDTDLPLAIYRTGPGFIDAQNVVLVEELTTQDYR